MPTLTNLNFTNRYARLPAAFYTRQAAAPLPAPYLVSFNPAAAALIDLHPDAAQLENVAEMLTGNLPHWVLSYNPVAQALSQIHEPPVPIGEKRFDLSEEIAALTGWSVPLVKVRAFRARAEMQKCLRRVARDKYL